MKIRLESVFVSDLDKALAFYTNVLGFVKKKDIPMGQTRWVTVVSPDEPDGTELLLEPNGEHPPTKAFKKALYEEGIPLTAFLVDDIAAEYERLTELGVEFRGAPQRHGSDARACRANRPLATSLLESFFGSRRSPARVGLPGTFGGRREDRAGARGGGQGGSPPPPWAHRGSVARVHR